MDHNPRQRHAFRLLAVRALLLAFLDQASRLEVFLHPALAPAPAIPSVPDMEVLDIPAPVSVTVPVGQRKNLVNRCPAVRHLF